MNAKLNITRLRDTEEWNETASTWLHEKWEVPKEAYLESIQESQQDHTKIPQWYVVIEENKIIAGVGVIENDFHKRKDLAPNICALYVEEKFRCQGIAKALLEFVCKDLSNMGYLQVYLITDHTEFYEKCGWTFLCMAEEEGGNSIKMYNYILQ